MATTVTIDCDYSGWLRAYGSDYDAIHDSTSAGMVADAESTFSVGQDVWLISSHKVIRRALLRFDLSSLPPSVSISSITLKIYGSADLSTTDFDVTTVAVTSDPSDPFSYSDYSKLDTTDLGHLSTGACSTGAYNDITINATGISHIISRFKANTTLYLGLRSSRDISATSPSGAEYFTFKSWSHSSPPQLEITYTNWPEDRHPDAPAFPSDGLVDSNTQAVIQEYLDDMTTILASVADTSSNIDLSTDKGIEWAGTEKISWDSVNSRVVFDSLAVDNSITVADDFAVEGTATFGSLTAATASVGTYWSTVGTLYASDIKGSVTDNELVFTETGQVIGTEAKAKMYYYSTDNELRVNLYPTGESAKVGVLADWDLL